MRLLRFSLLLALAMVSVCGATLTASATISHSRGSRLRATRTRVLQLKTRRVASRNRTRYERPGRNVSLQGRSPRGRRAAALLAARRRPLHVAPVKQEVAVDIPAVPMKRWMILPALVGSHESLVRQNQKTEADGLERIEDDIQLDELRREGLLVEVPVTALLHINEGLPMNRRYCRPWTADFLTDLSRAHAARFRRSLQVNSAVRTVEYQRSLMRINGNAAPADGDIASPHLSGATIDIAKRGLSMSEISWMRAYLLPLEQSGKIDVEEEFHQACFHITVYKSYSSRPGAPSRGIASTLLAERVK